MKLGKLNSRNICGNIVRRVNFRHFHTVDVVVVVRLWSVAKTRKPTFATHDLWGPRDGATLPIFPDIVTRKIRIKRMDGIFGIFTLIELWLNWVPIWRNKKAVFYLVKFVLHLDHKLLMCSRVPWWLASRNLGSLLVSKQKWKMSPLFSVQKKWFWFRLKKKNTFSLITKLELDQFCGILLLT